MSRGRCDPIELAISIRPGATIAGRIVDAAGAKIDEALVISRLHIWSSDLFWRGQNPPASALGGEFALSGLDPKQEYPVYFLEPRRHLGATQVFRADSKETPVVLKPCGQASARFVDSQGQPRVGFEPIFQMVVTPGVDQSDYEAARQGKFAADADLLANIDPANYGRFPKTDEQGRLAFPELVPGATYRLAVFKDGKRQVLSDFSVKSGEQLDLADVVVDAR